jgi:hypothetical protein
VLLDPRIITARNLLRGVTPTAALAVVLERLEETSLPLQLLGTAAAGEPMRSWAAVQETRNRTVQVVRVDDHLGEEVRVLRIERRRVVLEDRGRLEQLGLREERREQADPRRPSAPVTESSIPMRSESADVLDR